MIPLKDENPSQTTPVVNITLIAINVLIFLYELSLGRHLNLFIRAFGLVPYEVTHFVDLPPQTPGGPWFTLFTSMFLHGGWMHLIGNMLFLWVFGDNVEDAMGHFRYLVFYLLSGIAAALVHILTSPSSMIPTVGASGAISGVLGAYFVLYPRARILTLIPLFFWWEITVLPAFVFLGFWFIFQLFQGVLTLPMAGKVGGVAWWAHIGGFVAGMVLVKFFRRHPRYEFFWD